MKLFPRHDLIRYVYRQSWVMSNLFFVVSDLFSTYILDIIQTAKSMVLKRNNAGTSARPKESWLQRLLPILFDKLFQIGGAEPFIDP